MFFKKPENIAVAPVRRRVPHWVKCQIFSSLERWKQHFRDKITKNSYCKEGVI